MAKKIVFIAPYPRGQAPSQRFRFEQYFHFFEEKGYEVLFHPFLNEKDWAPLYQQGSFLRKGFSMIRSFCRRFLLLFKLRNIDSIFIHREASMIGPPIFEWFIAKVLRKKYIYDFDDAIWLPNYSESNARFHRLKAYGKVKRIIKWADKISVGNTYLKEYAEQYNSNVTLIPTTIDMVNVHNKTTVQNTDKPVIGWTGSHTTMEYLKFLVPILKDLEKEFDFTFRVISNHPPEIELDSLEFVKWNKATEIEDLAVLNIGVMPLEDTIWAKGKCGFKCLQYMALQIPSVISPVGVNNEIVEHGKNGFLCATPEEWKKVLAELLKDQMLRERIGKSGQKTVRERYSVMANSRSYLALIQS
ncbi:MAG: glycosyltransferase family 4 protein [Crocinitomicaceae bacterium]|nr:glycosyltransferase family 4 protein [Crocinitomicaceae bacterium]